MFASFNLDYMYKQEFLECHFFYFYKYGKIIYLIQGQSRIPFSCSLVNTD